MGMSSGNSRTGRVALSEINVTPLVDVMLVLLIIFMVTAPLMQQGLNVELPETEASGVETSTEPITLVIDRKGKLKIGKTSLANNELQTKLKALFDGQKKKQIYIQADKRVDYGRVAEVMAEIRAAGIYQIGLVTIPLGSR